jgi:hypothetical protein
MYFSQSFNMSKENPKKTFPFVCPACLTVYHLYIWQVVDYTMKCNYCRNPLERMKDCEVKK